MPHADIILNFLRSALLLVVRELRTTRNSIGGYLSHPVERYPSLFSPGGILEKHPYLLPCLTTTSITLCGLLFTWLFLEEVRLHHLLFGNRIAPRADEACDRLMKVFCMRGVRKSDLEDLRVRHMVDFPSMRDYSLHPISRANDPKRQKQKMMMIQEPS